MLIYCRFALVVISFILLGCSGSDDNSEEINLPPVIELQAPSSALSLEQLTITAQVTDPENEYVSLLWHLSSDGVINMEHAGIDELNYQIPLTPVDTVYTVSLVATDSHGNQASKSSSFTVPALDVSFTLPFDAISQRYVDTEAQLLNIASTDVDYSWEISQGSDYSLTSIAPNRVRFFAAKELTEEYDPNAEPERIRGEGITEELVLTLTVSDENTNISFNKAITVQPIQKLTAWPEHIVSAETQATLAAEPINSLEVIDNCLSRETTTKKYFDYNLDGIDDVFCTYGDTLYFYLSDIDSAGETTYTESVVIENQVLTEYSELIDLDKDGRPELVFVRTERVTNSSGDWVDTIAKIASLTFNLSTLLFDEKELVILDPYFYDNFFSGDYHFAEEKGILSMAFLACCSGGPRWEAKSQHVLIYDLTGNKPQLINSFSLGECESSSCEITDFTLSDIDSNGVNELIYVTYGEQNIPSVNLKRIFVITDNYTKLSQFDFNFIDIYQEHIDGGALLEWVGVAAVQVTGDSVLASAKLHLMLDQDGEPKTEVLESYYSDLFFNYGSESYEVDLNQDEQLDEFTKLSYYEEDYYQKDRFYSYTIAGSDKRVLISTESYDSTTDGFIGLEDMNNNGYQDLKFGQVSEDNIETVTSWLENIEGYPFE